MATRRLSRPIGERRGPVAHPGETTRSPARRRKVIQEAIREPEGTARSPQGCGHDSDAEREFSG
jgi:hypothetical protein